MGGKSKRSVAKRRRCAQVNGQGMKKVKLAKRKAQGQKSKQAQRVTGVTGGKLALKKKQLKRKALIPARARGQRRGHASRQVASTTGVTGAKNAVKAGRVNDMRQITNLLQMVQVLQGVKGMASTKKEKPNETSMKKAVQDIFQKILVSKGKGVTGVTGEGAKQKTALCAKRSSRKPALQLTSAHRPKPTKTVVANRGLSVRQVQRHSGRRTPSARLCTRSSAALLHWKTVPASWG